MKLIDKVIAAETHISQGFDVNEVLTEKEIEKCICWLAYILMKVKRYENA